MTARLVCENLCKQFGGLQAVNAFGYAFHPGSITALIGPNGAGKTTIFNILSGALRTDTGEVYVDGVRVTNLPAFRMARVGVSRTFQDLGLIWRTSVLENVMLGSVAFGTSQWQSRLRTYLRDDASTVDRARNALTSLGIADCEQSLVLDLSYGQQKLVGLASCFAANAPIMLLDEPAAGLHPDIKKTVTDLLTKQAAYGKTVVFIEHDLELVRDIARTVLVMDEGRLLAVGPPDEVLSRDEVIGAYLA